tara:strand:+ start:8864 stop:9124 length:261 start_codon:yes stop_codon:yes gene_type:complete
MLLACGSCVDAENNNSRQNEDKKSPERFSGSRLTDAIGDESILLLDVRRPDEITQFGTVSGALNIPIEELADRLDEVPKDRKILTA